ncbi:MAG TPA: hypothetical protein VH063_04450 [Gaiellaceae bacterium]|jgi:hypothetical protein|nr:hypothetical protein [Gaiellaceae bacterium]
MRALLALGVALVIAPAGAAASKTPDPCGLLTSAQVTKAIGYKVQGHTAGGNALSRSCTWSAAPIGFTQSRPDLMLQASRLTKAKFLSGAAGHAPIAGLGGPGYELMNGSIVLAWRNGVALMFEFVQTQATPKSTLVVVSNALANL